GRREPQALHLVEVLLENFVTVAQNQNVIALCRGANGDHGYNDTFSRSLRHVTAYFAECGSVVLPHRILRAIDEIYLVVSGSERSHICKNLMLSIRPQRFLYQRFRYTRMSTGPFFP